MCTRSMKEYEGEAQVTVHFEAKINLQSRNLQSRCKQKHRMAAVGQLFAPIFRGKFRNQKRDRETGRKRSSARRDFYGPPF